MARFSIFCRPMEEILHQLIVAFLPSTVQESCVVILFLVTVPRINHYVWPHTYNDSTMAATVLSFMNHDYHHFHEAAPISGPFKSPSAAVQSWASPHFGAEVGHLTAPLCVLQGEPAPSAVKIQSLLWLSKYAFFLGPNTDQSQADANSWLLSVSTKTVEKEEQNAENWRIWRMKKREEIKWKSQWREKNEKNESRESVSKFCSFPGTAAAPDHLHAAAETTCRQRKESCGGGGECDAWRSAHLFIQGPAKSSNRRLN